MNANIKKLRKFRACSKVAHHIARNEEGSITIMTIFIILMLFVAAGVGIDYMRMEHDRMELQATLDRAVLAAANKNQTKPPQAVVEDYIQKAGFDVEVLDSVYPNGEAIKTVGVQAKRTTGTYFMSLIGIDTMEGVATSAAAEAAGNVEISLVLDVSGSMGPSYGTRLEQLKPAAITFVNTIFENNPGNRTMISLVPYNMQVNAGPELLRHYNVTAQPTTVNGPDAAILAHKTYCVNFADVDFESTSLLTTTALQRDIYNDPWSTGHRMSGWRKTAVRPDNTVPGCPVKSGSEVLAFSNSVSELEGAINALDAGGSTAIDVGMKWGVTLVDPAAADVLADMRNDALANPALRKISANLEGMPSAYDQVDAMKVVVLMSDGENAGKLEVKPSLSSGQSDVWHVTIGENNYFSVKTGTSESYDIFKFKSSESIEKIQTGASAPYSATVDVCIETEEYYRWDYYYGWVLDTRCLAYETQSFTSVRLTFPELWKSVPPYVYHVYFKGNSNWSPNNVEYSRVYTEPTSYDRGAILDGVTATEQDVRLSEICTAAKDQGIIVYTVAFEAPERGETALNDCASSPAHFHKVTADTSIADIFSKIAVSVQKLRLVQ